MVSFGLGGFAIICEIVGGSSVSRSAIVSLLWHSLGSRIISSSNRTRSLSIRTSATSRIKIQVLRALFPQQFVNLQGKTDLLFSSAGDVLFGVFVSSSSVLCIFIQLLRKEKQQ